jgi:hypothetical protein
MTGRASLKFCYELAFYPPRLNEVWYRIKQGRMADLQEVGEQLDTALLLHQALPDEGYASQRALNRLALYQAKARAFGMVRFLRNLRHYLGRTNAIPSEVPAFLVRDIGLPPLARSRSVRHR